MKKIILPGLTFLLVLYTFLAMMLPASGTNVKTYKIDENSAAIQNIKNISSTSECSVNDDGVIVASGSNPNISYDNINQEFKTLTINLRSPSTDSFQFYVIFETVSGEKETIYSFCTEGMDQIVIPYSKEKCKKITFGRSSKWLYFFKKFPIAIQNITLYSEEAAVTTVPYKESHTPIYIVIGILIGMAAAGIIALLDRKKSWSDKLPDRSKLQRVSKKLLLYGSLLLFSCGMAWLVEYPVSHFIIGSRSDGSVFNVQRFIWIAGILMLICSCIYHRKTVKEHPEKLFLCILMIVGMTMILTAPFGHISWDTDSHYRFTLNASYLKTRYISGSDYWIVNPSVDGVYWPGSNALINNSRIQTFSNDSNTLYGLSNMRTTIAHILPGIVMAWVRFAGINAYYVGLIVKFSILVIYSFVCYVAMKKLKSGKMILAVVALFPTSLFLATNFSYDYWVTAFTILGMAWFVGEMQQPEKKITVKDTVIMCGAFAIGCLPKLVYVPLMIIPFFMNRKKIENKKRYYLLCTIAIVVVGTYFLMTSIGAATGSGDARGGSEVNSLGQVQFILNNPVEFTTILLKFLKQYLSVFNLKGYTVDFAYLGFGSGEYIILFLLFLTIVTDKNEYDLKSSNWKLRSITVLLYLGLGAAIASALYISYTAVGSNTIEGCQYRYLIPLFYPMYAVLGYNKLKNPFNRRFYNYFVLLSCSAVNFACIYKVMLSCWN